MKMILPNFSSFWRELEVILTGFSSTSTVFNQYRDCNHEIDLPAAASIRINNLRGYMEKAMGTASVLVVGEAAGPWGCRFSGIPFTGEKQLLDKSFPYCGEQSSKAPPGRTTKVKPPYISKSAEMFWEIMHPHQTEVLVWDAFPLHSHKADDVLTVRNPTTSEVAHFRKALLLIKTYMKPREVIAVGRKADKELAAMGEPRSYVRHPSRGGKGEFCSGMEEIFARLTGKR
jgi:hypothetical protein